MIYWRCPHCNHPYSGGDEEGSAKIGKEGTCNGQFPDGCGKKFIRIETNEKLKPIETICLKCWTVWKFKKGIIGTWQLCGEHRNDGCGQDYFGFEWLGSQKENNLISNMASFFSFGLIGENKQKCPRCSMTSNTNKIGVEEINGQVVVSHPKGFQEWHNQYWLYFNCTKCLVVWSNYRTWKA